MAHDGKSVQAENQWKKFGPFQRGCCGILTDAHSFLVDLLQF